MIVYGHTRTANDHEAKHPICFLGYLSEEVKYTSGKGRVIPA